MSAWHEVVVHAAEATVRAFVVGFLAGRGEKQNAIVFGADVDLEPESLGERLKELFVAGSHRVLLAPAPLAEPLAQALDARGRDVGIVLDGWYVVRNAGFMFRAEIFARPLAAELRAALSSLPVGVEIADLHDDEEVHPDAEAVDLYAPVHRYVCRVSGRIVGAFPGVFEMNGRLREMDFVEVSRLHLETTPAP